jgi:hypothetical protein
MALERTPLDPATLSDPAKKALGAAGPMKMMAARGLAPLPRPADMASVLYQLSLDGEEPIKAAAEKTAGELPDKILAPALADASLDPRVLDFFAGKVAQKPALVEAILLNKNTADETVRDLATKLGERELEIVAGNEQRMLRHPAIIAALYLNPKCRMSTVDRAIELAVRNKVQVPGIPSWDDVVAAVLGVRSAAPPSPAQMAASDAAFSSVAAFAIGEVPIDDSLLEEFLAEDGEGKPVEQGGETVDKQKKISQLSIPQKIRLATLGNAFARSTLIRDSNKQVALAAIKSPGITDNEAVKYAANRALADDVIRVIADKREWTRLYQVKLNLVTNPKCPLNAAMRFLPFLHDKDLRNLAKSKGIPSALAAQAKKLVSQKTSGGGGGGH